LPSAGSPPVALIKNDRADEVGDCCPASHISGKMIRAVDVDPRDRGGVAQSILSRAAGVMSASDTGAPVRWFE
jgi:hypothetical protein